MGNPNYEYLLGAIIRRAILDSFLNPKKYKDRYERVLMQNNKDSAVDFLDNQLESFLSKYGLDSCMADHIRRKASDTKNLQRFYNTSFDIVKWLGDIDEV